MQSLQIQSLTKQYKGFLLDNVTFTVPRGAVVGLIGENGAGKSTILGSVLGTVHPNGGSVLLDGRQIGELSLGEKQKIAFVQDTACLPVELSVRMMDKVFSHIFLKWNSERFLPFVKSFLCPKRRRSKNSPRAC